jgi:2-polyprenyl-6-methoxyphenol hydroxylase-like FAD-dependent oxidoreductase
VRILVSGASIAGPVLAYWLRRYGFEVTVVERSATLRKSGGHAVDLFRPAMDIVEMMGVLGPIQARATGIERLGFRLEHRLDRHYEIEIRRLMGALSDRHLEIMRDDLSEILHGAMGEGGVFRFGDSISSISEDPDGVEVTFEQMPPERFDLVIGADGLHSNVRRLVFGEEKRFATWIGGYLSVVTLPNYSNLVDVSEAICGVNRMVGVYATPDVADARAVFLFRPTRELAYHYRDVARQKELLREAFAGMGWEVPRVLSELDHTPAFYFDSITQLRMDTWSRGRVTLVGDAGYCPGPAVGGSTSLAIVGAYTLAGELAEAAGDHTRAFDAYEREIGDYVRRSRAFAMGAVSKLIPTSQRDLRALVVVSKAVRHLPLALSRALTRLSSTGLRLHDSVKLKDYSKFDVAAGWTRKPS